VNTNWDQIDLAIEELSLTIPADVPYEKYERSAFVSGANLMRHLIKKEIKMNNDIKPHPVQIAIDELIRSVRCGDCEFINDPNTEALSQEEINRPMSNSTLGPMGPEENKQGLIDSRITQVILDLTTLSISGILDKNTAFELMTMARSLTQVLHELEDEK